MSRAAFIQAAGQDSKESGCHQHAHILPSSYHFLQKDTAHKDFRWFPVRLPSHSPIISVRNIAR